MWHRRHFLTAAAGLAAGGFALPKAAVAEPLSGITTGSIRGSINAYEFGIRPGAVDNQSRAFAKMLEKAGASDTPVFLPPGIYTVSNLTLPRNLRLTGVPGATRILYDGDGHLFQGEACEHIELTGLVIDGANRWLADYAQAVVEMRAVRRLVIDNCEIVGSSRNGIALEKTSGRIERTTVSGAAEAGIYSVDGGDMRISGNTVADCANGGILVHRWQPASDGTIVTGNRVERIRASHGGTGQFGNGINLFRADDVMVANNHVVDCAFSAIRANSASNVQITSNMCLRSGETGIYSEFAFQGAVINANVVDGAAHGISMVNFDEGGRLATCSGNLVRNLSTTGPYEAGAPGFGTGINVEADSSVTANVIEGAPLYGMSVGWGSFMRNVVVTGNVIRDTGEGIAVSVVEGTGSAVISDNIISDAKHGAIVGHRWVDPATGDLSVSGNDEFPHLTVERNQTS